MESDKENLQKIAIIEAKLDALHENKKHVETKLQSFDSLNDTILCLIKEVSINHKERQELHDTFNIRLREFKNRMDEFEHQLANHMYEEEKRQKLLLRLMTTGVITLIVYVVRTFIEFHG